MENRQSKPLPPELFEGLALNEIAPTLGRWALLQSMGYGFTPERDVAIARNEMKGYGFWGAIHKTWGGLYGDGRGIELADLEIEAEILGVYEDVFAYRGDVEDLREAA